MNYRDHTLEIYCYSCVVIAESNGERREDLFELFGREEIREEAGGAREKNLQVSYL